MCILVKSRTKLTRPLRGVRTWNLGVKDKKHLILRPAMTFCDGDAWLGQIGHSKCEPSFYFSAMPGVEGRTGHGLYLWRSAHYSLRNSALWGECMVYPPGWRCVTTDTDNDLLLATSAVIETIYMVEDLSTYYSPLTRRTSKNAQKLQDHYQDAQVYFRFKENGSPWIPLEVGGVPPKKT